MRLSILLILLCFKPAVQDIHSLYLTLTSLTATQITVLDVGVSSLLTWLILLLNLPRYVADRYECVAHLTVVMSTGRSQQQREGIFDHCLCYAQV